MIVKVFKGNEVRSIKHDDGSIWFVAKDVCDCLEIKNARDACKRLKVKEKGVVSTDTLGGKQDVTIISESGLYKLIMQSRKKEAEEFQDWITEEVLPDIRKHGAYMTDETLEKALLSPEFLIQVATELKKEKEARKLAESTVNLLTHDERNSYYIEDIAKERHMTRPALFKLLVDQKVIFKRGESYYQYKEYATWFEHKDDIVDDVAYRVLKVTQNGRVGILNLISKVMDNVYPIRMWK